MGAKLSAAERKKYATVHEDGKDKYPIKDAKSAESALRLINSAKPPLSPGEKSAVRRRAAKYVGEERVEENRKHGAKARKAKSA